MASQVISCGKYEVSRKFLKNLQLFSNETSELPKVIKLSGKNHRKTTTKGFRVMCLSKDSTCTGILSSVNDVVYAIWRRERLYDIHDSIAEASNTADF